MYSCRCRNTHQLINATRSIQKQNIYSTAPVINVKINLRGKIHHTSTHFYPWHQIFQQVTVKVPPTIYHRYNKIKSICLYWGSGFVSFNKAQNISWCQNNKINHELKAKIKFKKKPTMNMNLVLFWHIKYNKSTHFSSMFLSLNKKYDNKK